MGLESVNANNTSKSIRIVVTTTNQMEEAYSLLNCQAILRLIIHINYHYLVAKPLTRDGSSLRKLGGSTWSYRSHHC
jgi:hypothetical protein